MNEPANAKERQLRRLIQGALRDGSKDEAAPFCLVDLESEYAAACLLRDHPRRPEQAILTAYLYGRMWSDPELKGSRPPGQPQPPENLRAVALKWIRERRQPRPEPPPLPPEGQYDQEFLQELLQQALAAGFQDEKSEHSFPETVAAEISALLLGNHPHDPHWAIILGYCSSRANAIAYNLGRSPTAEPDRWFNQAMLNWLQDQEKNRK